MTLQDPTDVRSAIVRVFALLVSEALGYVVFLLNLPVAVSLILMFVWLIVVVANVYHLDLFRALQAWAPFVGDRSLDVDIQGCQPILAIYAKASFVVFIFWEIIRAIFRLKRASLKRNLMAGLTVSTIGWGIILLHIPFMSAPPKSSRFELAAFSVFLYVVCVGAYSVGCLITHVADNVIDRATGRVPDAAR